MSTTTVPIPTGNSSANAGPSQTQAEQITIEALVQEILNASDPVAFAKRLKQYGSAENFETMLVSPLASGQDPLLLLDMEVNTLGYLYILSSRLNYLEEAVPPINVITDFCERFNVEQARLAPERVTLLANGIVRMTEVGQSLPSAIPILLRLLTRYNPILTDLTPLHAIFVRTCVSTRRFTAALPILSQRITDLMQPTPGSYGDLHYKDYLIYHYAGGMALAALRKWKEAEEFFELVVTCPAMAAAAIQLEAFKKLTLVQLIVYGKVKLAPKYAHPAPMRQWRNSPYYSFAQAYPSQIAALNTIVERENQLFSTDKNVGFMKQVLEYAPRWSIKKLTEIYVTMSLSDIGREVGIANEEAVRPIVISMIEQGEIYASLSADGTVTFEDPPPSFTKNEIEEMLRAAQAQALLFSELDRQTGRSKDFLSKVLTKGRDDGPWGMQEEENFRGDKESWGDETNF